MMQSDIWMTDENDESDTMTKKMRKQKTTSESNQPDFEASMEALEAIIDSIESGEIGLEKSLAEYEKGVELIARCRSILENAEQRVETLRFKASGDEAEGNAGGSTP